MVAQARHKHDDPDGKISTHSLARRTLIQASIVIGLLALATFVWYSLHVLLLIFAGILLAILLRGLADFISVKTGLGHGWSLLVVLLILITLFGGGAWLLAGRLVDQVGQFGDRAPAVTQDLKMRLDQTSWGKLLLRAVPAEQSWQQWLGQMHGSARWVFSSAISAIVTIVVILFIGLYMAAEPRLYVRGALWLIPRDKRDRVSEVMGAVGYTLKWWLIAEGIDMLIIGTATFLVMWWLGIPLALLIGFLAGLLNFIPNFGPILSFVPAAMLAMSQGPDKVLWVAAAFVVLQCLEGYLLLPNILRKAVELPAALTISAQVLLALLAGPLGLALAAPLTAATFVAVKMLYVEDTLGEHIATPDQGPARAEVREVKKAKEEVNREAAKPPQKTS